jgi:hypothetical protein
LDAQKLQQQVMPWCDGAYLTASLANRILGYPLALLQLCTPLLDVSLLGPQ